MKSDIQAHETFSSPLTIRALVFPVGSCPREVFVKYLELLRKFSKIELATITPPQRKFGESPFPNLNYHEGSVTFDFVENAMNEHISAPFQELHAYQKFYLAIGIIHCPNSPDLASVYPIFHKKISDHDPFVRRCFAFEPLSTQADLVKEHLVMIPNTPDGDEDDSRLMFYVQTLVSDMCSELLGKLEEWVVVGSESVPYLFTPIDHTQSPDDLTKLKKRRFGRMQKRFGDLSLAIGSSGDAIQYFAIAADVCKSNSDWIWLGGALEGQACCKHNARPHPVPDPDPDFVHERCAEALRHYTRKKAVIPGIELNLKLARLWAEKGKIIDASMYLAGAYNLAHNSPAIQSKGKAYVTSAAAGVCLALGLDRKAALYIRELALLYEERGAWSTGRGLMLFIAPAYGLNLPKLGEGEDEGEGEGEGENRDLVFDLPYNMNLDLKSLWIHPKAAIDLYPPNELDVLLQLCGLSCARSLRPVHLAISEDYCRIGRRKEKGKEKENSGNWTVVQKEVLLFLIRTSLQLNDYRYAVVYAVFYLQKFHSTLDSDAQFEFNAILQETEAHIGAFPVQLNSGVGDGEGHVFDLSIPRIEDIKPILLTHSLQPRRLEKEKEEKQKEKEKKEEDETQSPFLYSPFQAVFKKKGEGEGEGEGVGESVVWVKNEECEVSVVVSNPLAFPLNITAVLCIESIECETLPETLILPPNTSSTIKLHTRPLRSGVLCVVGVEIVVFGLRVLHRQKVADQSPVKVTVIDSMPLLRTSLASKSLSVRLCDGEERIVMCAVENIGYLPITRIHLECDEGEGKMTYNWAMCNSVLKSALPILPSDCVQVPISIQYTMRSGKGEGEGEGEGGVCTADAVLRFQYGHDVGKGVGVGEEYSRCSSVVLRSVGCSGMSVCGVEAAAYFKYGEGVGEGEGVGDMCCLLVELVNSSVTDSFQVSCVVDGVSSCLQTLFEPGVIKRVVLPLVRMPILLKEKEEEEEKVKVVDMYHRQVVQSLCDRVHIHWESGSGAHGSVHLNESRLGKMLSYSSMRYILPPPLSISLTLVNNESGHVTVKVRVRVVGGFSSTPPCTLKCSCVRAQIVEGEEKGGVVAAVSSHIPATSTHTHTHNHRYGDVMWIGPLKRCVPSLVYSEGEGVCVTHVRMYIPSHESVSGEGEGVKSTYRFHCALHVDAGEGVGESVSESVGVGESEKELLVELYGKQRVPVCESALVFNV